MESLKEQELLEAAAVHLILLSNPIDHCIKEYDSAYGDDHGGSYRMKRIKLNYGGVKGFENNKDENSLALSSSSCSSSESFKSGIPMDEEDIGAGRRHHTQRLRKRSIVDIYNVTRPL
ncbi:hypothetical protein HanRHA438_Chr10g0455311 [Helianthus annuus]|nr:hypothetical protein HanIR_Chr10g0477671 [Helianthus annuus]KAJ0879766.1 hypothetical protein HanRHA438_Chr10g0455311 [Helianthus annuus]